MATPPGRQSKDKALNRRKSAAKQATVLEMSTHDNPSINRLERLRWRNGVPHRKVTAALSPRSERSSIDRDL
jgi:hypothetical protein